MSNTLTGIRFRSRNYGQIYWIRPPRDGYYPAGHPLWGQQYSDQGKVITAAGDGYFAPTHDLETIEYLTQPKFRSEIVIVWPGQDIRDLPKGQVRNFGTQMTEWEHQELDKIIAQIKQEDGIVNEPPIIPKAKDENVAYMKRKEQIKAFA